MKKLKKERAIFTISPHVLDELERLSNHLQMSKSSIVEIALKDSIKLNSVVFNSGSTFSDSIYELNSTLQDIKNFIRKNENEGFFRDKAL